MTDQKKPHPTIALLALSYLEQTEHECEQYRTSIAALSHHLRLARARLAEAHEAVLYLGGRSAVEDAAHGAVSARQIQQEYLDSLTLIDPDTSPEELN